MTKIIGFLFSLFLYTGLQAAEWVIIAEKKDSAAIFKKWELDLQSVIDRDGIRQAWTRHTTSPPVPTPDGKPSKSSVSLDLYDCTNKEHAVQRWVMYSGQQGTGEVLASHSESREAARSHMMAVIPSSYGDTVLYRVCSAPHSGQ